MSHVNRGTFSMRKACPILVQCVTFISTKKYFHACLWAVCLEAWPVHVPVLASQECQDFSPHLRPRLVVLNVAGTPWQVASSFMPIIPQWFHCGEKQKGPSLLPQGTDTKEVMPLSSDAYPIPKTSGNLECPSCVLTCNRFWSWVRDGAINQPLGSWAAAPDSRRLQRNARVTRWGL